MRPGILWVFFLNPLVEGKLSGEKWGEFFLNLKAAQQPMNLLGGTADPQQPATSWEPDPQQPETPHPEQTNVCFPLHWAVALTASCFLHTQASHNLWYPKTRLILQHEEKETSAGPLLSQLPWGEGRYTLKRRWLHSVGAATAVVMGMPASSLQKEKSAAFLWEHRVD